MQVEVAAPGRGTPRRSDPASSVVLQQDAWDDFGFKTQYHLYYYADEDATFIGNVKILQLGQEETAGSLLPIGSLAPLPLTFCSLGQSLDYYERLAELPLPVRKEILGFLRDALAFPEHAAPFKDERGWSKSITRDMDVDSFSQLALTLLERDYSALPSIGLDMTFHAAGWEDPLQLSFAAPSQEITWENITKRAPLPERVAVIVGRNGSGKSTLLARLARVLHATPHDRSRQLKRLGTIVPAGIGFTRIITIAYSAFDTFQVPGVSVEEKQQIISDLRSGTGRYIFSGLRDIARELEDKLRSSGAPDTESDQQLDAYALDRQDSTHLKSADQLADEYARLIELCFKNDRASLLHNVLEILLTDPSFSDGAVRRPSEFLEGSARTAFKGWSTGHKIVMHMAATLVAHAQPKSIILLDEPESHLHPPLLAALMHAVRLVLRTLDAFAIVATHSPVVVQETLGRHVSVVNRVADTVVILSPKIETYGESIGEITDEVFGLSADATDYHKVLRQLVGAGATIDEIETRFDRGLSFQARAYVLSVMAENAEQA